MRRATITTIALPNGFGPTGSPRLSLFLAPRLESDEGDRLDLFSALLDWPAALDQPGVGYVVEFAGHGANTRNFVFTVCDNAAGEACPIWPGQPMTAHWGLPDPAAVEGNEAERRLAFAETLRMLRNRIGVFVSLPIKSLDKLSLQNRLREIGRS